MIEFTVRDFLDDKLDVPVYLVVPKEKPDSYVVVERTGGTETNHITRSTIAVQSYANTLYDAAMLNEKVKETMNILLERDDISAIDLNSDYNFTDTMTHKHRYQAVFDIVHFN